MNTLKYTKKNLHIQQSFWFKLEDYKLNTWGLQMPEILLKTKIHDQTNFMILDENSYNDINLEEQNIMQINLINYNTMNQLCTIDRKQIIKNICLKKIDNIKRYKFDDLYNGVIRVYTDIKNHIFHYCVGFPEIKIKSPIYIKNKYSTQNIFNDDEFNLIMAHLNNNKLVPHIVSKNTNGLICLELINETNIIKINDPDTMIVINNNYDIIHDNSINIIWKDILFGLRILNPQMTELKIISIKENLIKSTIYECYFDKLKIDINNINDNDPIDYIGWTDSKIHIINLNNQINPEKIIESASNMNLSLMKWRMEPNLNLEKFKNIKVLLLGAGTLGCNIARSLIQWGVRNITFIDKGRVSYSNPVRQTLFEMNDCDITKNNYKSIVACDALKRILPTCNANGIVLNIRMPGHKIDDIDNAKKEIVELENYILNHDVIFLLTDSRESRWLPTVLANAHNKPIINTALGFDSYVVMRHGLPSQQEKSRLGCYFCSDVIAPIDSLSSASLDQQCTVTRPGVSMIASAISIELFASLLNHDLFFNCENNDGSILGKIPHQIRGSVKTFENYLLCGLQYNKCIACSKFILEQYKKNGLNFIIKCINEPLYMEEITGLKQEKDFDMNDIINFD
jgi:ubiquitin-like modifier-activating enzyme ATG7